METPPEFRHLAHCFHQDMMLEASTEEGIISNALRCLQAAEQLVVKNFLTELLQRNPSGQELQDMWNGTGPDWGFPDDHGLRRFLEMIRDMIQ